VRTCALKQKGPGEHLDVEYLDGHRIYRRSDFKTPLFEHHDGRVVDTGSYGQQTWGLNRGRSHVSSIQKPR